jgi:hypothetical protein
MNNQAEYVAFSSTEGVGSSNPLFLQKDLSETAMLHVMQLFPHLQSNLVPIQGAQGAVSVYATQDNGHATASLFFVNRTSNSLHISVQAESILPWSSWPDASLTLQGYSMTVLTLHRNGSNGSNEIFSFDNAV